MVFSKLRVASVFAFKCHEYGYCKYPTNVLGSIYSLKAAVSMLIWLPCFVIVDFRECLTWLLFGAGSFLCLVTSHYHTSISFWFHEWFLSEVVCVSSIWQSPVLRNECLVYVCMQNLCNPTCQPIGADVANCDISARNLSKALDFFLQVIDVKIPV